MIEEINKLRFINSFVVWFVGALHAPIIIIWQGSLEGSFISFLFIVAAIVKMGQPLTNNLTPKMSLWLPLAADLIFVGALPIVYFSIQSAVIVDEIGGALFMLAYMNRGNMISELLKKKFRDQYDLRIFGNRLVMYGQAGGLCGGCLIWGYFLIFPVDIYPPTHIYVVTGLFATVIICIYNIKLNLLIEKEVL